jgi:hypothetical protein
LRILSDLCLALAAAGTTEVSLAAEVLLLLDRISEPVDYQSVAAKQARLRLTLSVSENISREK